MKTKTTPTTPTAPTLATTAAEWIQTIPSAVLAAAARGDLDLNAIAREELAGRGLNREGTWVGFPEAKRIAAQLPTVDADGRRVFVTIPTDDDERPTPPAKPTRDEFIAHAFATFTASSAKDGRGLVVSVADDMIDALVADAQRLGLVVRDVNRPGTGRAQARIWSFNRTLSRREHLSNEAVRRAQASTKGGR
jgi:hypothetical protein